MKLTYPYENKPSKSFGTILTASFWIDIDSPAGHLPFLFLFDTGADVTSLPTSSTKKLGIDLDKCPQVPMGGYEGTTIYVYKSQIKISFNNILFAIPCVFNPNEEVPILLGRAGILDRFTIVMDGKRKMIIFKEI